MVYPASFSVRPASAHLGDVAFLSVYDNGPPHTCTVAAAGRVHETSSSSTLRTSSAQGAACTYDSLARTTAAKRFHASSLS